MNKRVNISSLTLILPEMLLARETMGLAISMSLSRSWKAFEISVSRSFDLAAIDFSIPLIPERIFLAAV